MPNVDVIIPTHNCIFIAEAIESVIHQSHQNLNIIIIDDGSTDDTKDIVQRYRNLYPGKIIYYYQHQQGPAAARNTGFKKSSNEYIAFLDADDIWLPEKIEKQLLKFKKDPKIGSVSGLYILRDASSTSRAEGEGFYWHYETFLKTNESTFYSILGAHGALYALRKSLFQKLPARAINDDYILPMYGVQQKKRAVYEPNAVAVEETTTSVEGEMKRRIRISVGNFQQLFLLRKLLNPFRGRIAFEFLSHKFLRSFSFLFMLTMFISNIFIPLTGFRIFLALQILFYALGLSGIVFFKNKKMPILFTVPFYLIIINYAAFVGLFKYLSRTQKVTWERPQ